MAIRIWEPIRYKTFGTLMIQYRNTGSRFWWMVIGLVMLGGCSSGVGNIKDHDIGPTDKLSQYLLRLPTVKAVTDWPMPAFINDRTGSKICIKTNHYEIYTTLTDPLILRKLPVLLESAYASYSEVIGKMPQVKKLLVVYFFDTRRQWDDFTRHWAGPQAESYLKITAGAYYLNGACVAYKLTRRANFSVLAHEGWHQFSQGLFRFHLPAWLDEGLATNFEAYQEAEKGKVTFNPHHNASRLWALKQTVARGKLFSISELLQLDAGRVVAHSSYDSSQGKSNPQVATYYAQIYALTRFLREYNYSYYQEDFQRMLSDAYLGRWPLDEKDRSEALRKLHNPTRRWNAKIGTLIFKTYIAPIPPEIEDKYQAFCLDIVSKVKFKKRH